MTLEHLAVGALACILAGVALGCMGAYPLALTLVAGGSYALGVVTGSREPLENWAYSAACSGFRARNCPGVMPV